MRAPSLLSLVYRKKWVSQVIAPEECEMCGFLGKERLSTPSLPSPCEWCLESVYQLGTNRSGGLQAWYVLAVVDDSAKRELDSN